MFFKRQLCRSFTVAKVKSPAPGFTASAVINHTFQEISLKQYLGNWVVLFFYPLDFTFVCPTEIIAFSEQSDHFGKINTKILACSTDSKFSHLQWIKMPRNQGGLGEMKIPLISDFTKSIAKSYGVLLEDEGVALRGTFIIDPLGVLRQSTINDLGVGRNIEETLRLVEALQFTDKHGEVCPADWKKGSKTIKPDVVKSKEYFESLGK